MKQLLCCLLVCLVVVGSTNSAPPPSQQIPRTVFKGPSATDSSNTLLIPASKLRRLALHNAGFWSLPISCAGFPPYGNYSGSYRDPETDLIIGNAVFPPESGNKYIFSSGIWIGGIVNGDTLVSTAYDSYYGGIYEFWPPDPEQGGLVRSGDYADDEFIAVYSDTVLEPYVTFPNPFDDTSHIPLGIKIAQQSYSWKDTLYDNFVIFEFVVENIGENFIQEVWFALIMDPDIFTDGGPYGANGWTDDASGVLDTLLYDGDSTSRAVIPYSFDMDGDPGLDEDWEESSMTGVVSIGLLEFPKENPKSNFNWWITDNIVERDFGPRQVGTAEDPFRPYAGDFLGTAHRQQDKYYQMAHPEMDYNQIEVDIHDSADGWIPSTRSLLNMNNDTKFLYSIGSFDLAPNDTAVIAIALIASERFHVNPSDFDDYFDPQQPQEFYNRLDFTEMMINHRRADSVYRSGLQLPIPGPPVGLRVIDYDEAKVTLAWRQSDNSALAGYYVNVKDTVYDDIWRRAHIQMVTDTVFTFSVSNPAHELRFAVTRVDTLGRESDFSFELPLIPATPHPPSDLTITLDGLTPVLNWLPYSDTSLMVYMVYRSTWNGGYILHDSVSALEYRDYTIESGVRYNYKVAAKNDMQLVSEPAGPVSALPVALDNGVLFYDMNYDQSGHFDPYHRRYVDRLVHSVQPLISMDYYDIEDGFLPFKNMCDYSVIVFDSEMRGGEFNYTQLDSIRNYLSHGGKALFIVPNASTRALGMTKPITTSYGEGRFFYDIMFLDSVVTNGIVLLDDSLRGDLMGCQPQVPEYPLLAADMGKVAAAPIPVGGYIPLAGYLFPSDSVEYLYSYQSMYPDSVFQNQINGIRYIGETYSFVFFNFQLSLMEAPENVAAFRQAFTDLGVDLTCGDINDDQLLDVGDVVSLVAYLFLGGPVPPDLDRADVNCDGEANLGDAQVILNAVFLDGAELNCCK